MPKRILTLTTLAAFLALSVAAAEATPGQLDPTFGSRGRVTVNMGEAGGGAQAVVVQPDGRIVVGGWAGSANLALARFKPNGKLDSTFGSGGKVTASLGSFSAAVYGLALQPDRKIVAAGVDYVSQHESDFVVARYRPNGSLDPTFGDDGIVTTDFDRLDTARAVVVQPDGTIVVAGDAVGPGGPTVALARYRPDGSLDRIFGSGGKVRSSAGIEAGTGLVRQPDGKLVVAAKVSASPGPEFTLIRFEPAGSLDASFGSAGIAEAPVGSWGVPLGVALQTNGKLVAAANGADLYGLDGWGIARWNDDGTLDEAFGHDGVVMTKPGPNGFAGPVAVQRNGKIVTAGYTNLYASLDNSRVIVVRYRPNGDLDAGFGMHGVVTMSYANVDFNYGDGLALQGDGKILVAGSAQASSSIELIGLARLLGDTCVVPRIRGKLLAAAMRAVTKAGCLPGKLTRAFSATVKKGRIVSQTPRPGARVAASTKVTLVVSRGKRRR